MSEEKQKYYILDSKSPAGNCAVWWRPSGMGYTRDLREAGVYTKEQLPGLRKTDIPIPVEEVTALAELHCNKNALFYFIEKWMR